MKYRIIAILSMTALLLTGCSVKDSEEQEVLTTIPVYNALPLPDLSLDIPEGYEATSSEFYETYYIQNDASIIITEDTNGPFNSSYDYAASALTEYQKVANELEIITNEPVRGKNCSVHLLEFRYTLGEDNAADMTCLAGFATDGSSMYIITCKSNTSTYSLHHDEFYTVMQSVMMTATNQ